MNFLRLSACGIALLCATAANTRAQLTIGHFTGAVTSITDSGSPPPDGVNLGDRVSVTFSYGTPSFSFGTTPKLYIFSSDPLSFAVTIGASTWSATSTSGFVKIANDNATLNDRYEVNTSFVSAASANFPGALANSAVGLFTEDAIAPFDLVSGLALPRTTSDVNLAAATTANGSIISADASFANMWSIEFSVQDFSLSTIPEPSSVALVFGATSFLGVLILRRKRPQDRR